MSLGMTELGYVNRNDQMVLRKPGEPDTDHLLKVYVLRCLECGHEYGANGSDIPACCCPICDGGRPGLAYAA